MLVILSHSWLDTRWLVTVECQVTSDRLTNIGCQVTSDRLWPTLGVKWRVTDYDQHQVSSHMWQTMTNIGRQVRHLTPDDGDIQSLVTWYPMFVIICHSWLDTQCWSWSITRDLTPDVDHNLSLVTWHTMFWPILGVKLQVIDYDQHSVSSDEWQNDQHRGSRHKWHIMTNIEWGVTAYYQHRVSSHE
jgi:hypothetical protein